MAATQNGDGYRYKICGATKKDGSGPCTRPAGWGTNHVGAGNCRKHGGSTPTGIKYGQRVAAEEAVKSYGLPREIDPDQALMEELWRCAGHVAWLGAIVGEGTLPAAE